MSLLHTNATRRFLAIACLAIVVSSALADEPKFSPEQTQFFEAKIRPLLVDNCVKCHGPEKQKGHLRLDSRAGGMKGGDLGPAVVPGKLDESMLVSAIGYEDEQLKMPPSKKLAANQVADLRRWIEMGAPWPGPATANSDASSAPSTGIRRGPFTISEHDRAHWAFQPVKRPAIPGQISPSRWAQSPVDAFILAELKARGLHPNPPAEKHELIRRVYYDLTGLPPSPADVDAFLNDTSPSAYEALLDRLLASPHYGEKWARHWLDLVRFAETNSYERDDPKPSAWRYRDYVVRSLNDDKPYDRFVREQLAGDEIDPGNLEALTGTGFYRLGIWDDEPTDRVLAHYDGLDDIVATTGQVFLGLTVDCARCHDHKIDPIAQKDYYRLLAIFQNVNDYRNGGPTDEAPDFTRPGSKAAFERSARELEQKRNAARAELASIESEFLARDPSMKGREIRRPDIEDLRYRFFRDTWDRLPDFGLIRPEATGELPDGLFDLAPRLRDTAFGFVFDGLLVVPVDGEYTFFLDSDDGSRLTVSTETLLNHDGVHELGGERTATRKLSKGLVPIKLEYFQRENRFGLNVAWSGPTFTRRALSVGRGDRRTSELAQLIMSTGESVLGADRFGRYRTLQRKLVALLRTKPAMDTALCVTEPGPNSPDTFVLLRGNAHVQGDKVEPGFVQVLGTADPIVPKPPPGARSSGRRAVLAQWIASPTNPLTARVIANRLWQHHFGRGIVRSPSNFGTQGDKPTHPELLDWLASEVVEGGWRLKALHKTIMMSSAYQMSSRSNPEGLAKDPANDTFWRFDMRRLSAEELRDSVLAASGSLNAEMYGPGIYPTIPAEVLQGQSMPGKGWGKSSPAEQARRSVYIHVKRSLLLPLLEGFDLAETDRSTPVRFSTTQPTQALAMLNGSFLHEQAGTLAARIRREAGDDPAAQVRLGLKLVSARLPGSEEVTRGVKLIEAFDHAEGAKRGDGLRAFSLLALNLNEFLYLD